MPQYIYEPARPDRKAEFAKIIAAALQMREQNRLQEEQAKAAQEAEYVKNLSGSVKDYAEYSALSPEQQEMMKARGLLRFDRPQDRFDRKVAEDSLKTFDTLPQSARQQGTFQTAYGAAMPAASVDLTNAQDVYGNKDSFVPEMQTRQGIKDGTLLNADQAADNAFDQQKWKAEFEEDKRQFGMNYAIAQLQAKAQAAKLAADTRHAGVQTENELLKRDPNSPLSPGFKQAAGPLDYQGERRERMVDTVANLRQRVGGTTAGVGSMLAAVPGTPSRDFRADLDTLKANIAFGELQEMRDASKTGGALGQVAIREIELLESSLGALDQGQSPANLDKNLARIEARLKKWEEIKARMGAKMPTSTRAASKTVTRQKLKEMAEQYGTTPESEEKAALAEGFRVIP